MTLVYVCSHAARGLHVGQPTHRPIAEPALTADPQRNRALDDPAPLEICVSLLERLKPTDREIRELALRETDPSQAQRFAPIERGPVFALLGLAGIGLAALPSLLWRLLRPRREKP